MTAKETRLAGGASGPPPALDVILPVYNSEATIRETLDSISAQTFSDFRVIVVDDGSADGTCEVVRDAAGKDDRITLVRQPNGGIVEALNTGLQLASAPIVARQDGDDISYLTRFEDQLRYLSDNQDCVAVSSNADHIEQDGGHSGYTTVMKQPSEADPDYVPSREPYLIHPLLMARRDAVEAVGKYRFVFHAEDVDLYWRLSRVGRLHNLPDVHGAYRMHPASVSSKSILNGRIAAMYAQLSAIDFKRAEAGAPGLDFSRGALKELEAASTLDRMLQWVKSIGVKEQELGYLEIATAAKVLELASYRPFEPDPDDARFIRRAIERHGRTLAPQNARNLRYTQVATARRLIWKGMPRVAAELLPISLYPRLLGQQAKVLVYAAMHARPTPYRHNG